jgi:cyclopropane fatty-acyl-phospholipid synthase-like methyltransferase
VNARRGDGRAFAIATDLLDDSGSGWSNLGLWPPPAMTENSRNYADACAALALETGRAAALNGADSVLEMACGQGAALRMWREAFSVHRIEALDTQRSSVEAARRRLDAESTAADSGFVRVHHAGFDAAATVAAAPFTAVICVDAAYHADSLAAFTQAAAAALRTNGRVAFTTLLHGERWAQAPRLPLLLAKANIPPGSVPSEAAARATLAASGFIDVTIRHLDGAVLAGFAAYIDQRARALPWHKKISAGWLKIRLTAALCGYAHANRLLHYSLITATLNRSTP